MKVIIINQNKSRIQVIARNRKISVREMKNIFNEHKFAKTINCANNISGELGVYEFIKR